MADTRDLLVKIKGDTNDFERSMKNVKDSSDGAHLSFGKLTGAVFAGQAIFNLTSEAIRKSVDILKDSFKEYQNAETSQKELENAVINVTHATREQLKATNDLANSLSNKGVLDDDVIRKGLAQLSTFGLTNDSVRKLGKSMADLTVQQFGVNASGEDAVSAANMMSKALLGNSSALVRMGIYTTEAQKHLLKFGNETQRVNTVNEIFAANLRTNQATALETTAGKVAHLNVQYGNLKEAVGGMIARVGVEFVTTLSNWIDAAGGAEGIMKTLGDTVKSINDVIKDTLKGFQDLWNWFSNLTPVIIIGQFFSQVLFPVLKDIAHAIWTDLKPALEHLLSAFGRLWAALNPALMDALKIIGALFVGLLLGAILAVAVAIDALMRALSFVISVIANVIGWIANVIGWLGNLAGVAINTVKTIVITFSNLWQAIRDVFGMIGDIFRGLWGLIWGAIKDIAGQLYNAGRDMIRGLANGIKDTFKDVESAVSNVGTGAVNKIKGLLGIHSPSTVFMEIGSNMGQGLINGISNSMSDVQAAVSDLATPTIGIAQQGVAQTAGNAVGAVTQTVAPAPTNNTTINLEVNMGMYAGMPVEKRQIAEELWRELVRSARAQNVILPNIGSVGLQ